MRLSHLPEPWRPNAIYKLGDRVALRDQHAVFVVRCGKGGRCALRPPKLPENAAALIQYSTEVIKIYDAECEWWLERVIRKTYAPRW
jgi:hypothetical protein